MSGQKIIDGLNEAINARFTVIRPPGSVLTWHVIDKRGQCWFVGTNDECWRWIDEQDPWDTREEETRYRVQRGLKRKRVP